MASRPPLLAQRDSRPAARGSCSAELRMAKLRSASCCRRMLCCGCISACQHTSVVSTSSWLLAISIKLLSAAASPWLHC